jgi:hypothetical protein
MANKTFYLDRNTDPLNPSLEVANKDELIKVYDDASDMESDISNIEDDEIVSCKGNDYEGVHVTDTVSNGNLNPVTSNAVYQAIDNLTQYNPNYVLGEIDTGATWIDGKHIYRRVIHDTTPATGNATFGSNANNKTIQLGTVCDNIIDIKGYVSYANDVNGMINVQTNDSQWVSVWARNRNHSTWPNTLGIACGNGAVNFPITIIIEYTKSE